MLGEVHDPLPPGEEIGRSRRGRPIFAYRIGRGPLCVSLIGGCHADEPVGPRFLLRLVRFLAGPAGAELRRAATWSVIPHVNPDGEEANAAWQTTGAARYDLASYLRHRVRELPGDDIEFGFPHGEDDNGARAENRAAWEFWRAGAPFDLHVSMHGMSVAAGPYFLIERSWWLRCGEMAGALTREVEGAGYTLHDVERHGEKGFHRLGRGFCSRPDSRAMRRHFLDLEDPETAARFRPSSMEAVRSLGGDTLTLVTEMPLFITPGVGAELGPPDPVLMRWRERIAGWEARIREDGLIYRFFSDLEEPNRMDAKPFLEFDLSEITPADATNLKRFTRDSFNLADSIQAAENLKYTSAIKSGCSRTS